MNEGGGMKVGGGGRGKEGGRGVVKWGRKKREDLKRKIWRLGNEDEGGEEEGG